MEKQVLFEARINGEAVSMEIPPSLRLVELLREKLKLTGTKEGCGAGDCGACTVIIDGQTANSCILLAMQAEGKDIYTIEGFTQAGGQLHPIQQAFIDAGAVQCGYCIPGMVLSAKTLLDANQNPDEQEIQRGISGNLCRCTGYQKIVEAVDLAAKRMK